MQLYGIDFTSSPSLRKPITLAQGWLDGDRLQLTALRTLPDWASFEASLREPGPWLGAFDFPFGLPRAGIEALGWPQNWPALIRHCQQLGRKGLRAAFDADRLTRPSGARYPHRATDRPAGSHSPMKLVNPPLGLMFLEGAARLLSAGVSLPGLHRGDPSRIALEAYPGLLARRLIGRQPYKGDDARRHDPARQAARARILEQLCAGQAELPRLCCTPALHAAALADGRGDLLDAILALLQAALAWRAGPPHYGLPAAFDPLEGWICGAQTA